VVHDVLNEALPSLPLPLLPFLWRNVIPGQRYFQLPMMELCPDRSLRGYEKYCLHVG
jgi:hypothetical protein